MKVFCTECQEEKDYVEFYKRFITDEGQQVMNQGVVITTLHDAKGICKECLIKKFTHTYKLFNNNFEKTLRALCEDYNLPFVVSLINNYTNRNFIERLNFYIKDITSLPQYKNMTYFVKKEKSDLEFVNEDIKQLKKNIEKAIQNGDFNAHNKWMNCLRDAIELREKLIQKEIIKSTHDNSIAIGNALKNIRERIICHDILSKINKITGSVMSNNDFYDILKDISNNWKHLSKETKDDLAKLIAGEKDKSYFIVLLDSFSK